MGGILYVFCLFYLCVCLKINNNCMLFGFFVAVFVVFFVVAFVDVLFCFFFVVFCFVVVVRHRYSSI